MTVSVICSRSDSLEQYLKANYLVCHSRQLMGIAIIIICVSLPYCPSNHYNGIYPKWSLSTKKESVFFISRALAVIIILLNRFASFLVRPALKESDKSDVLV